MRRGAWLVRFVGVTLLLPALGLAAEGDAHERSRAAFRAGNEAFRAGELEKARRLYQEALVVERRFDVVCNLGRTEAELGDDRLALTHLDECLREYPPDPQIAGAHSKFFELREAVRERCRARGCESSGESAASDDAAREANASEPVARGESALASEPDEGAARSSARIPITLSLATAGLVAVGVGIGFQLHAGALDERAQDWRAEIVERGGYCAGARVDPACGAFRDAYTEGSEASTWALSALALGGGLLVSSVVTYVLWPSSGEERSRAASSSSALPGGHPGGAGSREQLAGRIEPWMVVVPGSQGYFGIRGSF